MPVTIQNKNGWSLYYDLEQNPNWSAATSGGSASISYMTDYYQVAHLSKPGATRTLKYNDFEFTVTDTLASQVNRYFIDVFERAPDGSTRQLFDNLVNFYYEPSEGGLFAVKSSLGGAITPSRFTQQTQAGSSIRSSTTEYLHASEAYYYNFHTGSTVLVTDRWASNAYMYSLGNGLSGSIGNTDYGVISRLGTWLYTMERFHLEAYISDSQYVTLQRPDGTSVVETNIKGYNAEYFYVDAGPPSISIFDSQYVEEGEPAVFVVALNRAYDSAVSVDYQTVIDAAGVSDFTTSNATLTFAPGEKFKTISIVTKRDELVETPEDFSVVLSNPTSGSTTPTIGRSSAIGTIGSPLFSSKRDVVDFNNLTLEQTIYFSGQGLASMADALAGNDSVVLPNTSEYDALGWSPLVPFQGGAGDDTIMGGDGGNWVHGGAGKDTIHGRVGDDRLSGNSEDDHVYGDEGLDTLFGDEGNDHLAGGIDPDKLYGGLGNDVIAAVHWEGALGDLGGNTLSGDANNDTLYSWFSSPGALADTLSGGADRDTFYVDTNFDRADLITDFESGERASDAVFLDKLRYVVHSDTELTRVIYFADGQRQGNFRFEDRIHPNDLRVEQKGNLLSVVYDHNEQALQGRLAAQLKPTLDLWRNQAYEQLKELALETVGSASIGFMTKKAGHYVSTLITTPAFKSAVSDVILQIPKIGAELTSGQVDAMSKELLDAVSGQLLEDLIGLIEDGGAPSPYDNSALDLAKILAAPLTIVPGPLGGGLKGLLFLSGFVHNEIVFAMELASQRETDAIIRSLPDSGEGEVIIIPLSGGQTSLVPDGAAVSEALGTSGHDHVIYEGANLTLPANVENGTLTGSGSSGVTTQSLAPERVQLEEGDGEELLYSAPLSVSLMSFAPLAAATAASSTLTGNALANRLVGNSAGNLIIGAAGADTLEGRGGLDTLMGGTEDDEYIIQDAVDVVVENAGEGTDRVVATVSYSLTDNVENLLLFGTEHISGRGNALANRLEGSSGNNVLEGLAGADSLFGHEGDDLLVGGAGADTLGGGAGRDIFSGTVAELTGDTILDFAAGDRVRLTDAGPGFAITKAGSLLLFNGVGAVTLDAAEDLKVIVRAAAGGGLEVVAGAAANHDFSGDAASDILWRNDNGTVTYWRSTGTSFDGATGVFLNVSNAWKVNGDGDFNGDGRNDILWRHDSGALTYWSASDSGFNGATGFQANVSTDWKVVATGDVNGDGLDDLLFRNDNGALTAWTATGTGTGFNGAAIPVERVGTDWKIDAAGDFDGDGRDDILWRNDNGALTFWTSTGTAFNGGHPVEFVGGDWKVAGSADFDGDGRDDILWRNDNGALTFWTSTGTGFNGGHPVEFVSTDWKVTAVGDFNGDGLDDILWRNDNGALTNWASTGSGFNGATGYFGYIGSEWKVVNDGGAYTDGLHL